MSLITGGQHTDKWYNLNRVSPKICRWSISMWIGSSGSLGSNTSKDVESSKFSFWCCHSGRRVRYGGKMIEFLCKVEPRQQPPPGPEQFQWRKTKSGRNSPRTHDWRENTSNMPGNESPRFSAGLIRPQADVYKLLKWDLKGNLSMRCQIKLSPAQLLL